jgi:hypothetical protein
MNRHAVRQSLLAIGWFALVALTCAATNNPAHTYPSGAPIVIAIGHDLYATLDPRFQKGLDPKTIAMEKLAAPVIALSQRNHGSLLYRISISQGFIDLLNHIAHAKVIDQIEPGYFAQYVSALAQESAHENPPAPANLEDPRFWTDAVMAEQTSLFNQMISMTLAMNLSHYYLDHYAKYAAQMPDGKLQPINNLIAADEWEASVRYATVNSLDCALATQGAKALFDFIDQMPRRPAWASYIVPPNVNIKKLNHELFRYEHDYFHGGPTMHDRLAFGG